MAGYVILRLPHEVKTLFRDWLARHYPLRAERVMARIHDLRDGRDNDPEFGSRMQGSGEFATLIRRRFALACTRLRLNSGERFKLDTTQFRVPGESGQLGLF